jgi:hypothetical protein
MRKRKDVSLGVGRQGSRVGRLARAAVAGLRKWSSGPPVCLAAPRALAEALELRQLLNAQFSVSIAGPPTATAGQQFYRREKGSETDYALGRLAGARDLKK